MKPKETRDTIETIGMSMSGLARLLKTGRTTPYRWMEDGTTGSNAILLRLLASGKVTIKDVEQAHD